MPNDKQVLDELFKQAVTGKATGYRAHILFNGQVGITPAFTLPTLKMYVQDEIMRQYPQAQVLRIVEEK